MTNLRSGIRWNAFGTLVGQGSNFARLLLVSAATTAQVAGTYAIAVAVAGGVAVLAEVGFRQQFISTPLESAPEDVVRRLSTAWLLNIVLKCCVALLIILLLGANSLVALASRETLTAAFTLAAAGILSAFNNPVLLERERLGDFRASALCDSAGQVAALGLVLAFIQNHASLELLVLSQVAASAIQVGVSYAFVSRAPFARVSLSELLRMAKSGHAFTVIAIATYVTYGLDKIAVGLVASTSAVGNYYMAQRVSEVPTYAFSSVIGRAVLPAYLRARSVSCAELLRQVRVFTRLCFLAFAPLFLVAIGILHSPWFVSIAADWPDVPQLLSLLLVAALFRLGCHLLSPAMIIHGDVASDARFKVQEAVVYVPLLFGAVWSLGTTGAAICTICVYAFSWWRRYLHVSRYREAPDS